MDAHDQARQVAVLDALYAKVGEALTNARRNLADSMETGDRVTIKTGDAVLGSATKAKGASSARVSDPTALLNWALVHHPDEVVVEKRLRPALTARLLAQSKAAGVPTLDGVLDVPGVTVTVGEPKLQLRAADDAADTIERLWQAGELDLRELLALPEGDN
jgi:hypothetical protein